MLKSIVLALLLVGPSFAADPMPTLPELLKEHKALGLPFPPKDAKLVRYWCPGGGTLDDGKKVPPFELLSFQIKPATKTERAVLSDGFNNLNEFVPTNWNMRPREVKPDRDAIQGIEPDSIGWLFLAIHCQDRVWDELVKALMAGVKKQIDEQNMMAKTDDEKTSFKEILERQAWTYHIGRLSHPTADRGITAKYLRVMISRVKELDTDYSRALLKSLDLSMVPGKGKPGSIEALIDQLVDYNTDTGVLGIFEQPKGAYRKLVELGFDAVPALIEHLGDERLTRAKMQGFNNFRTWNLRVGDLIGDLIEGLADEELPRGTEKEDVGSGSIRRIQGWPLKKTAVNQWWEKAKKEGEEKYLLNRILPKPAEDKRRLRPDTHMLTVIAAKYPKHLPSLYRKVLEERSDLDSGSLALALAASSLPHQEKLELLIQGTKHKQAIHRCDALIALKNVDAKQFDTLLIAALEFNLKALPGVGVSEGMPIGRAIDSGDAKVWEVLEKILRRSEVGFRVQLLESLWQPYTEQRWRKERLQLFASFLDDAAFLDPKTDTRFKDADPVEVRNVAAMKLGELVDIDVFDDPKRAPEDWAKLREQVRAAVQRELKKK